MKEEFELITADFTYVPWLGNRKGIEEVTKTWEKTVVDRREDLTNLVEPRKYGGGGGRNIQAY